MPPFDAPFLTDRTPPDIPTGLRDLPPLFLRSAAAFWTGTSTRGGSRARSFRVVAAALGDAARIRSAIPQLTSAEMEVLQVVRRYGGAIDGGVLEAELRARGLIELPEDPAVAPGGPLRDPVRSLEAKALLLRLTRARDAYPYFMYGALNPDRYPPLAMPPEVATVIPPAEPLGWDAEAAEPPERSVRRRAAEVAFDLGRIHAFLLARGSFDIGKGSRIGAKIQGRIDRSLPSTGSGPLAAPDSSVLYVRLLHRLHLVRKVGAGKARAVRMDPESGVSSPFRPGTAELAWHLAQDWMEASVWQDGVGASSGQACVLARKILAWALSRIARADPDWIDITRFARDLCVAAGGRPLVAGRSWRPALAVPSFPPPGWAREAAWSAAEERWLDADGRWAANAVLVTLVEFGLVERGENGAGESVRFCFRLTPEGRAVFGAPEVPFAEPGTDPHFLSFEPDLRIVADLEQAPEEAAWTLAHLALSAAPAAAPLRILSLPLGRLDAASIETLLSGELETSLRRHSRGPLPASVETAIAGARRRYERVILRLGVTFAAFPSSKPRDAFAAAHKARPIGDHFAILRPGDERHIAPLASIITDHANDRADAFRVRADGGISLDGPRDLLTCAHLDRVVHRDGPGWKVGAASIRAARARGLSIDAILDALKGSRGTAVPPVLEVKIRAWCGSAPRAGIAPGAAVRIPETEAWQAIRASPAAQRFIAAVPAPGWIILRPGAREAFAALLREKGFEVRVEGG